MIISKLVSRIVDIIDVVTVVIIFFGFCYAIVLLIRHHSHLRCGIPKNPISLHKIRTILGEYLLVALELFICADVVLSVQEPSIQHLLQLGIIVVIRILIAYFLQKELYGEGAKQA